MNHTRLFSTAIAVLVVSSVLWATGSTGRSVAEGSEAEPADLAAFRARVGGDVSPVVIELKSASAARPAGPADNLRLLEAHSQARMDQQERFIAGLSERGVRLLPRAITATQVDGTVTRIALRRTVLSNSFAAYVATPDLARLKRLPEIRAVRADRPMELMLDKSDDYILGTQFEPADRRLAVYGATQELDPAGGADPEAPADTPIDGLEGQGITVAVIDSGIDWRHPMFGGTGHTTPLPRAAPNGPSATDNKKVTYYYNINPTGDPTDDYGHGTHVASTAIGYRVDGDTPANPAFGTGRDGLGVGPTLNGATLHGVAPQALVHGYKLCNAAGSCASAAPTEFAIEDAASPVTLIPEGGATTVAKPVADVINMSLGATGGSATASSSVASNNAALAGVIMVAAAGNAGPGASTIGSPCTGTLVICVAANLDPGSIASIDVLAAGQVPTEQDAGTTPDGGAGAGAAPETGATSNANTPQAGARQAIRAFSAEGGGPVPEGSISAHYIFADMRPEAGNDPPLTATNRIVLVRGTGAFASIANSVAPLDPAAIMIITNTESATAVAVIGGVPTYTLPEADANYLIDLMITGDAGDGDDEVDVPHGTVSELPLRLAEQATLDAFQPTLAGFSSRGPNSPEGSDYRTIKPDVSAPGVGIVSATTPDGAPASMTAPEGYVSANGTSMATPHVAGAMALIRQHLRKNLGFDTTDLADPQYRAKRFDTATIARALAQNTSTSLRGGRGVARASDVDSVNDIGSGLINVAGALDAKAILVSPTKLLAAEFTPPTLNPLTLDAEGNAEVLLPTASFGNVPVVGVQGTIVRTRKLILRDIAGGAGAGSYTLSVQNNRLADTPGFQISFLDGTAAVTSVSVPSGGIKEFTLRVAADGRNIFLPGEFMWYVTATHSSGRTLRMPFYYRAVVPAFPVVAAPTQGELTQVDTPAPDANTCAADDDGTYDVNFTYTVPDNGVAPIGFRVQQATRSAQEFLDDADEPLVAAENSLWLGTEQWQSQVNPDTGSPAYFVPDAADQNEVLTQKVGILLPPGSATLSFTSFEETEAGFDFAHVEASADDGPFVRLASFSGTFSGTRTLNLSAFAGKTVRLQFRLTSDLLVPAVGWYVEDIRIDSDDFVTIADTGASAVSQSVTNSAAANYRYRVAGLFTLGEGVGVGPYSNLRCVDVEIPVVVDPDTGNPGGTGTPEAGIENTKLGGALPVTGVLLLGLIALARRRRG